MTAANTRETSTTDLAANRRPSADELIRALSKNGCSVQLTARQFGVTRQGVYKWMAHYGIVIEREILSRAVVRQ